MNFPRLFRRMTALPAHYRGAALAIGNFDGLHAGHLTVLQSLEREARQLASPRIVMTFEPHPRRFFQPQAEPFRLTPLRAKLRLLAPYVDAVIALPFDGALAQLTAEDFVNQILRERLRVRHIVVGTDFCFGRGRQGDVTLLTQLGATSGFGVTACVPVAGEEGAVISSTRLRGLLRDGEIAEAGQLLRRAWEIEGHVQHGDARGRQLGFPTANLALGDYLRPAFGVYAAFAALDNGNADGLWHPAVVNIGARPTVGGLVPRLEAHWLSGGGDFYGRRMRVALIDFIRPEQKFSGIEALKQQINRDIGQARSLLTAWPPTPVQARFIDWPVAKRVDFAPISLEQ